MFGINILNFHILARHRIPDSPTVLSQLLRRNTIDGIAILGKLEPPIQLAVGLLLLNLCIASLLVTIKTLDKLLDIRHTVPPRVMLGPGGVDMLLAIHDTRR